MSNFTDAELNDEIEVFRKWVAHLWVHFVDEMRVFLKTNILAPESRKKHWTAARLRDEEVVQRTSDRHESLFFSQVTVHLVSQWLWLIMGKRFAQLKEQKERLYYLHLDRPVGASRGKATAFVKFDFDFSTPVAHAYPINETDVHALGCVDQISDFGFSMVYGKALPSHCLIPKREAQP